MKILSQNRKEIYEFEGNNIFVVDDIIFISSRVNLYEGKAGILGQYNNTEECLDVLNEIMGTYGTVGTGFYVMPTKKEEKNENQERDNTKI